MRSHVGSAILSSCQKMSASSRAFFSLQHCSSRLPAPLCTTQNTSCILQRSPGEHRAVQAQPAFNKHHVPAFAPLFPATDPPCLFPGAASALKHHMHPVGISLTSSRQRGPLAPCAIKQSVLPCAAYPSNPCSVDLCQRVTLPLHLVEGSAALSVAPRKRGLRTRAATGPSPVELDDADLPRSQPWVEDLPGWLEGIRALPLEERPCPMVVVFDIETTSLSRRISRIVEFAARDAEGELRIGARWSGQRVLRL